MSTKVALNTDKITAYFSPSPVKPTTDRKSKNKDEDTDVKSTDLNSENLKTKLDLSNSSVLLTPESSPAKDEAANTKEDKKSPSKDPVQQAKKPTACKKCLTEDIKLSEESPRSGKKKRRGRKKKGIKEQDNQTVTQALPPSTTKPRTSKKKKTEPETLKNTLLTDYFPVRRSDRRCKTELQKDAEKDLHYKLLNGVEDGLKVVDIENKGRGVIATKNFLRGDFVVEYAGDLIDIPSAEAREKKYALNPETGCYMYYFNFKNKKYCIDATAESGKLGRLLNHSKTAGNCHTKLVEMKGSPYLILVASRDITAGEELQYDYGDRSKSSLESHPWLKS